MTFTSIYTTPAAFDNLLLTSDGEVLTGLHFVKSCNAVKSCNVLPVFKDVCHWLDIYFSGREPDFTPNFRIEKMSAQAVGGAVGWNPIGIIIPCHRVVGAGSKLVGYGGGIENKIALLKLEGRQ